MTPAATPPPPPVAWIPAAEYLARLRAETDPEVAA